MLKKFYYIVGTGFGSGLTPVAPGTAGSIFALIVYYVLPHHPWLWLSIITMTFFIGVLSASALEQYLKKEDPGVVVIDEMAGQWIALLFLPVNYISLFGAFLFFRLFDIYKPFPINRSQNLKGGWGIMVDDVLAGIFANLTMQIILMTGLIP